MCFISILRIPCTFLNLHVHVMPCEGVHECIATYKDVLVGAMT